MEQKASNEYQTFKSFVMSKIIKEVDDCKDIIIQVHATLNEFMREYDLTGWVRNRNENDILQLSKDNNALIKENASLNKQIQKLQEQLKTRSNEQFGNFTFDELVNIFKNKNFDLPLEYFPEYNGSLNAFEFFRNHFNSFATGISNIRSITAKTKFVYFNIAPYYISFNFLERVKLPNSVQRIQTTKLGSSFYSMIEAKNMTNK